MVILDAMEVYWQFAGAFRDNNALIRAEEFIRRLLRHDASTSDRFHDVALLSGNYTKPAGYYPQEYTITGFKWFPRSLTFYCVFSFAVK